MLTRRRDSLSAAAAPSTSAAATAGRVRAIWKRAKIAHEMSEQVFHVNLVLVFDIANQRLGDVDHARNDWRERGHATLAVISALVAAIILGKVQVPEYAASKADDLSKTANDWVDVVVEMQRPVLDLGDDELDEADQFLSPAVDDFWRPSRVRDGGPECGGRRKTAIARKNTEQGRTSQKYWPKRLRGLNTIGRKDGDEGGSRWLGAVWSC